MLKELQELWTAFKNGYNGRKHNSIDDFLASPDHGPKWTETEILKWLAGLPTAEQDVLKRATKAAKTRGKDPYEYLCEMREVMEETLKSDQTNSAIPTSVGQIINAWPQFQAEWLLTSAFIKDTFGGGLFNDKR